MSDDPNRCKAMVRSPYLLDAYQCKRKPGYGKDGWYCKQHDPERIRERRLERCGRSWDAEFAERDRLNAIDGAEREAGEAAIEVCRMLIAGDSERADSLSWKIIKKLDKALKENG